MIIFILVKNTTNLSQLKLKKVSFKVTEFENIQIILLKIIKGLLN